MKRVDPEKAYRVLYPSVPAVVCGSIGPQVYAMPVVSIMSLSNQPPLIGVASSPSHSTHQAIRKAKAFSACWVDASMVGAVEFLGSTGHESQDKLGAAGLKHHQGEALDVPVVEEAMAVMECSLTSTQAVGDHELLVGRIEAVRAVEDFQEYWRFEGYRPLLYAGVQQGSLKRYNP